MRNAHDEGGVGGKLHSPVLIFVTLAVVVGLQATAAAQHPLFPSRVGNWLGFSPHRMATGDFDEDGLIDVIVTNQEWNIVPVLLGRGDGTFFTAWNCDAGSVPDHIATGDFDEDGHTDLAVTNITSNDVSVLLGNGDGTFQTAVNYAAFSPGIILTGDFDEDGHIDLATSSAYWGVLVCLGNGDGTFQEAVEYEVLEGLAHMHFEDIATGDFDGNGHTDMVVAEGDWETQAGDIWVLSGNGDGTFQEAVEYPVGEYVGSLASWDFNQDGYTDLAVTRGISGAVSVLLGDGTGTFGTAMDYDTGFRPTRITIGDCDGDGHVDLAVSSMSRDAVTVLLGNGDGTFRTAMRPARTRITLRWRTLTATASRTSSWRSGAATIRTVGTGAFQ